MTLVQLIGGLLILAVILGGIIFFFTRDEQVDLEPLPSPTPTVSPEPTPSPTPSPTPTPDFDILPDTGVSLKEYTFELTEEDIYPGLIIIKPGEGVIWKNISSKKRQIRNNLSKGSVQGLSETIITLDPGKTKSTTFSEEGRYYFFDTQNPEHKATVIVK